MKNYYIDYTTNTVVISKAFAERAQEMNSVEARLLRSIKKSFPEMTVINRTHSTPEVYHNADGSITRKKSV